MLHCDGFAPTFRPTGLSSLRAGTFLTDSESFPSPTSRCAHRTATLTVRRTGGCGRSTSATRRPGPCRREGATAVLGRVVVNSSRLPPLSWAELGGGKKSLVPQQPPACPSPPGRCRGGCLAVFASVLLLSSPGAAFGTFVILCVGGLIAQVLGWPFIFYIFGEPLSLTPRPPCPGHSSHAANGTRRGGGWAALSVRPERRPRGPPAPEEWGRPGLPPPSAHRGVPTSPYEMPGLLHVVKASRLKTCVLNSSHVPSYSIIITVSAEKPATYIPFKRPAKRDSNVPSPWDLRDASHGVRSPSSKALLTFILWAGWRAIVFPRRRLQRTVTCSR